MNISKEQVMHVAKLARLNLTDTAAEKLEVDMESIISFADKLNELDTDGVNPTAHAIPVSNAFREDVVIPSYDNKLITQNAPHAEDGCFVVPRVVE